VKTPLRVYAEIGIFLLALCLEPSRAHREEEDEDRLLDAEAQALTDSISSGGRLLNTHRNFPLVTSPQSPVWHVRA
jgi:hypothetical protein